MTNQVETVIRTMDEALKDCGWYHSSEPLSKRMGAERRYSAAYQQLVRMGARPQIRAKYRGAR